MKKRTYGTGSYYKRASGKYLLRYQGETKTIQAATDKAAERALRDWVDERDKGVDNAPNISMNYILDLFLADHQKHDRVETPIVEKKIDKYLRPRIGRLDAKTFGEEELDLYIASRKKDIHPKTKKPPANGTINREISFISKGLRLAASKLQRIVLFGESHLKESDPRQGITSEENYHALLLDLPDYLKPIWCFAYYTGVRSGQLKKLRWEWLDWDEWVVRCPGTHAGERITKNWKIHIIPVFLEMREFVKMMWEGRNPACPYLFQRKGKPIRSFRDAFKASCKRVGLPDLLFHDQRRTAVTNMIRENVAEKDAMAVSGHLDRSMLDRYMIVKEQDVKRVGSHMATRFQAKREAAAAAGDAKQHPELCTKLCTDGSQIIPEAVRLVATKYKQ